MIEVAMWSVEPLVLRESTQIVRFLSAGPKMATGRGKARHVRTSTATTSLAVNEAGAVAV